MDWGFFLAPRVGLDVDDVLKVNLVLLGDAGGAGTERMSLRFSFVSVGCHKKKKKKKTAQSPHTRGQCPP
jgi:hypothetical protein